jgi:hypothetical protein
MRAVALKLFQASKCWPVRASSGASLAWISPFWGSIARTQR